jgi:hypothetical protein
VVYLVDPVTWVTYWALQAVFLVGYLFFVLLAVADWLLLMGVPASAALGFYATVIWHNAVRYRIRGNIFVYLFGAIVTVGLVVAGLAIVAWAMGVAQRVDDRPYAQTASVVELVILVFWPTGLAALALAAVALLWNVLGASIRSTIVALIGGLLASLGSLVPVAITYSATKAECCPFPDWFYTDGPDAFVWLRVATFLVVAAAAAAAVVAATISLTRRRWQAAKRPASDSTPTDVGAC